MPAFRRNPREQRLREAQRCGEVALEAVLIHKIPAGLSPRLIPSSPQSLSFFSGSRCGLFCLLDFSLIWGIP